MLNINQLASALAYANLREVSVDSGVPLSVLKDIQLKRNTVPYSAIKRLSEYYGEECDE